MNRPKLLDLFCCAGGASAGYALAGFDVTGVDINPMPRYPFNFVHKDVMSLTLDYIQQFDLIAASPPCQAYSNAQRIQNREHPDLVGPVREMLIASGVPYVIENVEGAPLIDPVTLCGQMFELGTYRHRLFESSFDIPALDHGPHLKRQAKMGRAVKDGEMIQVVGNFTGVDLARKAMEIEWMSRNELAQAIPPAYTRYIGEVFLAGAVPKRPLTRSLFTLTA